jgi:nucleoside-diphosphate-sugar epimerase
MKNLLITGGLGYIGSSFIKQLNFENYSKIIIVDLDLFETSKELLQSITYENNKKKLVIKKINYLNLLSLENIFQTYNINVVIHLGGLVGDPACAFNLNLTKQINTIGTNKIVDLSIKYGVSKFVFASSCSVYGINDQICLETTEPKPISEYAISKINGENKLHSVKDKFDEIIIFRFSTLYGVSDRIRFDLVANLFYAKAKWENCITLYGGWQWRPFINVKDAGLAIVSVLDKKINGLNIYNVGLESGNSTLENLANLTKSNFPDCKLLDTGSREDARNYKVNFKKFNSDFGDILNFDLEKGINDLFNELKFFDGKWDDVKYSNLLTTKKYTNVLLDNAS